MTQCGRLLLHRTVFRVVKVHLIDFRTPRELFIVPEQSKTLNSPLDRLKDRNFLYLMIRLKVQNSMKRFAEYYLQNIVDFIIGVIGHNSKH